MRIWQECLVTVEEEMYRRSSNTGDAGYRNFQLYQRMNREFIEQSNWSIGRNRESPNRCGQARNEDIEDEKPELVVENEPFNTGWSVAIDEEEAGYIDGDTDLKIGGL